MDESWRNSNDEVSIAIVFFQIYAKKSYFSNVDERLREEAVQETVMRLLAQERFCSKESFDKDIKKFGLTVFHNVITDLARKEGHFRYSTKKDDTVNKTVQNFHEEYKTTETHGEDEPFFVFTASGEPIVSSSDPAKALEDEDIGNMIACIVNELLAQKEESQQRFLYYVVWNDKLGLTLKELAEFVGYQASNLPQIVKRFKKEIIKELKRKGDEFGFDEDNNSQL